MIYLETNDIRKQNMIAIFKSIAYGNSSLSSIARDVGISKMTACDLTRLLIDKNIIKCETLPQGKVGRRPNIYSIIDKYHCMFFEEVGRSYCCISIDINGNVIERFDYVLRNDISKKENIRLLYKKFRKKKIFNKYCIGVFGVCSDETAKYLPNDTIKTTKEDIILQYLSEPSKVILFKLGKRLVISAYSHIHYPKSGVGETTANKVLTIDKTYSFCDELYDGLFLAMQQYSLDKLSRLI